MIDYEALIVAALIVMGAVSLAAVLSIALESHKHRRRAKAHPFEDAIRIANEDRLRHEAKRRQLRGVR